MAKLLQRFNNIRQPGPIRVFWYDDHPKTVEHFTGWLNDLDIHTLLFGEAEELYQEILAGFEGGGLPGVPDVCITDMLIGKVRYYGINVGQTIIGQYRRYMKIPARVGMASHVRELVSCGKEVFCFAHLTSDLKSQRSNTFRQLVNNVEKYAIQLWLDHWCVNYMNSVKVKKYSDHSNYKLESFQFGYVVDLEGNSATVKIWNPQELGSEKLCKVNRDVLLRHNISEIQQPFRMVSFSDEEQADATTSVIEPLSKAEDFEFGED